MTDGEAQARMHYGRDCPQGMVQIEFVGVSPRLRYSDYSWKPSESAFLEIYVDGQRFHIDVGTHTGTDGKEYRGLHIFLPTSDTKVARDSVNTVALRLAAIEPERGE